MFLLYEVDNWKSIHFHLCQIKEPVVAHQSNKKKFATPDVRQQRSSDLLTRENRRRRWRSRWLFCHTCGNAAPPSCTATEKEELKWTIELFVVVFPSNCQKLLQFKALVHCECRNPFANTFLQFLPPFPTEYIAITWPWGGWNITCIAWIISLGGRKEGGSKTMWSSWTNANLIASTPSEARLCLKKSSCQKSHLM